MSKEHYTFKGNESNLEENFIGTGIAGFDDLIKGLPRGGLIVVTGDPGTGKTAFAISFVYNGIMKMGEPGVYASLIEEENAFYQYAREFGYDLTVLKNEKLFRYLAIPTPLEAGSAALMNFIIEAIEEIGAKRLVVDSFTALEQSFKSRAEARTFLHMLFSKTIRNLGCTTLLIREGSDVTIKGGFSYEDFIADGLILLKVDRLYDKLIREMTILKMRGNLIRNPDNCFTLYNGFQVLLDSEFPKVVKPIRITPPPDTQLTYSTGIPELDNVIGGYNRGSTVLLEIQPKVTREHYRLVVWPTPASFVLKGRPMITLPGMGSTLRDVNMFKDAFAITEEERVKFTRCFLQRTAIEDSQEEHIVVYDPVEGIESLTGKLEEAAEFLYRTTDNPPVIILSIDSLTFNYRENDVLKLLSRISAWTRKRDALLLLLDKSSHPKLTVKFSSIASIHIKLLRRHGCLMLFGVKPRTPLYAVQATAERPIPKLIPVV